jgi:hypothetical protein
MRNRVRHDSLDKGTLPLLVALSNPLAVTRSCEVRMWMVSSICSRSWCDDGTIGRGAAMGSLVHGRNIALRWSMKSAVVARQLNILLTFQGRT